MLRIVVVLSFLCALLAPQARGQTITVGGQTLTHCIKQYDGYCGSLARPLDPSGHVAGSIEIGFEFYPHTGAGPATGTIIAEEGGPGYSTTGSRDGYVRLFTPLRDGRDILLIDKRGTGRSGAIDCRPLQGQTFPTPAAYRKCGEQLGDTAWLYGSDLAADDVAAVLESLGTGPVDYYGDSYGTFFGQVFATRHPRLLRTVVLDSAYPVLGGTPFFQTEIENFPPSLDRVCKRSFSCNRAVAAGGRSLRARFADLVASLRATPVSGTAPGEAGESLDVTADPASLFLMVYVAGNNLLAYRDMDASIRALQAGDSLPLLRLVAEAEDDNSGGGSAKDFSVGLSHAVICQDYHAPFDLRASIPERRRQYDATLAQVSAQDPDLYAPFTLDDAIAAPSDPEGLDSCLAWPAPPSGIVPGVPVPAARPFPFVPVLVLAGELDTVTSPTEASQTAALFPNSRLVVLHNMGHETAVGDEGWYVPPYGSDIGRCAGPMVLRFMQSGGDPGDTSCAAGVRPIRTVPAFATRWHDVIPAIPDATGTTDGDALALASAAAETVGDAVARFADNTTGAGSGLRGGSFTLSTTKKGYTIDLAGALWTTDLAVSGPIHWNQLTDHIEADITLSASGHTGTLTIAWDDRATDAVARISGQIDGRSVTAHRIAP